MKTKSVVMVFLALGAAVMFVPVRAQAYDGYCREYTRTVTIGNRQEVAYGTACYQPDGSWKIVDEDDQGRIGQRFRDNDVANNFQPVYGVPVYQPVYYPRYYRPQPAFTRIVFIDNDRHRHDRKHYHRGKGHGRHDDRHEGRHRH